MKASLLKKINKESENYILKVIEGMNLHNKKILSCTELTNEISRKSIYEPYYRIIEYKIIIEDNDSHQETYLVEYKKRLTDEEVIYYNKIGE